MENPHPFTTITYDILLQMINYSKHSPYDYFSCEFLLYSNLLPPSNSDSIREKMKKNYLSNPGYNYDQINRASLACGPMVKWAIAQVRPKYIRTNIEHT